MNLIIEQLKADHRQMVRILYHLDKEAKAISGLAGRQASMESILEILDYIQVYPEIWHHPAEDVIFERLITKNAADTTLLEAAFKEHEVLELLTENLHRHIEQAVITEEFSVALFIKSAGDYVNRQLRHMEFEQKHVFPMVEALLDEEDWCEIKEALKSLQHLLEGPKLQRYMCFSQQLAQSSVVTSH